MHGVVLFSLLYKRQWNVYSLVSSGEGWIHHEHDVVLACQVLPSPFVLWPTIDDNDKEQGEDLEQHKDICVCRKRGPASSVTTKCEIRAKGREVGQSGFP